MKHLFAMCHCQHEENNNDNNPRNMIYFFLVFSLFSFYVVLLTGACNINPFIVIIINRQEIITLYYIHLFVMYRYAIGYRPNTLQHPTHPISYYQQINTINPNGAHTIRGQPSKNAYNTLKNWNQEEIKHCVMNRDIQCPPPEWFTNMRKMRKIVWIAMSLLCMNKWVGMCGVIRSSIWTIYINFGIFFVLILWTCVKWPN